MIDLNHATQPELAQLDGRKTAQSILHFREDNGKFVSKEELQHIVSPKTYQRIKADVKCGHVEPPPTTSTRTYRRHNKDEIESAQKDLHVCHIIAKSNGGADHADNYLLAGADFNVRIGNRHDPLMCAFASIERTKRAIRASRLQNNITRTVDDAEQLVKEGAQEYREYYRKYGEYPDRSEDLSSVDPSKIEDPDYCDWVIQVWNHGTSL